MKKLFNYLIATALMAFTFTSCEDVPSPFGDIVKPDSGGEEVVIEPSGDGTEANPYNVAGVLEFISGLGADIPSTKDVYVKGIITEITEKFGTQYGNATFIMSDTESGANKFTFYRGLYIGNVKYSKDTDTNIKEGDVVVICGKVVNYKGNTPETSQGGAYVVSINGQGGGTTPPTPSGGDPKGTGTQTDPFNVAAALAYVEGLGADVTSTNDVYISGEITEVTEPFGTQFGNATFIISDDSSASNKFTFFRGLYLGNVKYTDPSALNVKKGDKVVICGKVVLFRGNTPETSQNNAYVYSINGVTDGGGSGGGQGGGGGASGAGTLADPFNVQAIIDYVSGLAADVDTERELYVKGVVTEIPSNGISTQYNNLTFYISDDTSGSNKFQVFRAKGLNGGDVTENMIKVGDEVVIFGKIWVNYKGNTPETKQGEAYIVSITSGSGGGGGGQGGGGGSTPASSLTNGNFETWEGGLPTGWKSACTASSANLSQSTDAHGGSYSVKVEGNEGSNKRLASQEITLAAGTYEFAFYVKATVSDASQVRPGFVPVTDGSAGTYKYGDYANLSTSWQQVKYEFTLDAETTVCLVVMNPKKSNYSAGKDVLIDDATLTKK